MNIHDAITKDRKRNTPNLFLSLILLLSKNIKDMIPAYFIMFTSIPRVMVMTVF